MSDECSLMDRSGDEIFNYFVSTLRSNITTWDYFINWKKVLSNIEPIEKELNLLNSLIGKEDLLKKAKYLILEYPNIIKAIPRLLAIREKSLDVLVDVSNDLYKRFDFSLKEVTEEQAEDLAKFIVESGLGEILRKRQIKNFVDYVIGVEAGIDTHARKNRTGKLMERITEVFVKEACANNLSEYIVQASAKKVWTRWNIKIKVDKSSRRVDFAILKDNKLLFVETNFYSGGGSKLKSTAGEYITMSEYWKSQGIEFVWITDGFGWFSTKLPLREYFNKGNFLLNIKMLQDGCLNWILKNF